MLINSTDVFVYLSRVGSPVRRKFRVRMTDR